MNKRISYIALFSFLALSVNTYPMHIMEGFLPIEWASFWFHFGIKVSVTIRTLFILIVNYRISRIHRSSFGL